MSGQSILKSNCTILFDELKKAVDDYLRRGNIRGDTKYIDAFLAATIHAFIDYADGYLDQNKNDDEFNACRYANNVLKHNTSLVTHKKIIGGRITFPIHFPLEFPPIKVIWNYNKSVEVQSKKQQRAFENLFAGKPIIDTLSQLMSKIENI